MTLALRLAQQGKAVTLFEAAPSLGGLASAWQIGDVVWDRHYHVILTSDHHLRSLLSELNLESELRWEKARTGFYVDSRLYSMSSFIDFLQFPPLSLLDKIRLGATILRASRIKNWKALEKISAVEWLAKWSGRDVLERIWLPLLRAKLGDDYQTASAAFIWATIARMYAARKTNTKSELFGYVPGGYARIADRFELALRKQGVECRLGNSVRAITSPSTGSLRIELANNWAQSFDQVVVTAAAPLAAKLCPQLTSNEKSGLADVKYQGIICASVLLKQPLSEFYITNITDSGIPFTAVIEMSSLVDRSYFAGRALVYLPKYVSPGSRAFSLTDHEIRQSFLPGLEKMYPHFRRDAVLAFQVSRVKHVFSIPVTGYSEHLPPVVTSIPGLYVLNSAHIVNGTLNVNETVQLAEAGAQQFARITPTIRSLDYAFAAAAHR
jgi:protoporphyrinogen oxidase